MEKPFALIIDDDRDIVALFRHVLDMAGYRTEIILHGKVAVERLATCEPDIVLLDLNLPGVSGTEILHLIRSTEHLKGTQVIVITAHSQVAQSLGEEPELVLLKPVNIDQLSSLVQRLRPVEKTTSESPVDETTGIYNRSFFRSRLDYSLARSKQLNLNHFTVLLTDLGQFKAIESQLGEEYGRQLLQETAGFLKSTLRPTDTIARFEGAQFAILIENVNHWDIPILLANRILKRLSRHLEEKMIQSRVDIGIILCHAGYDNIDEILQDANTSLSLAKAEGKGCYKFYARDNFNNAYDIEMMSDMISLAGADRVRGQSSPKRTGIVVRDVDTRQRNNSAAHAQ
jgi:diguanylate cyclase (GGDEF)-like protein